jgi:hypothetical protein
MQPGEAVAEGRRLPAWLARFVLTGILAGVGAVASMLFGFGHY